MAFAHCYDDFALISLALYSVTSLGDKEKVSIVETRARSVYLLSCMRPYTNLSPRQCSKGLERILVLLLTPDCHARPASKDNSQWEYKCWTSVSFKNNCGVKKGYLICRRQTSEAFSLIQMFGPVSHLSSLLPLSFVWRQCTTRNNSLLLKVQRQMNAELQILKNVFSKRGR